MNTHYNVDTKVVMEALSYYEGLGYELISVPMVVDKCSSESTKPTDRKDLQHLSGVYVGSAEQSFIDMILKGDLKAGMYCAITPCYRDEPTLDGTHLNIFLKVELIAVHSCIPEVLLGDAKEFFSRYITGVEDVATEAGSDLEANGVELGSYGYRVVKGHLISYGTGLAEPRFSYVRGKHVEI